MNQQLQALIIETLNSKDRHSVVSEDEIFSELRKAGWEEVPDHKWSAYGEIVQIRLDWQRGFDPDILVVSTQLWIPCGSSDPDSAIYVFQGRARDWKLLLATDADFDTPYGSRKSGMSYELSPPDSKGKWFLAVTHAPPTCRLHSPRLNFKVLRPGLTADRPVTLLARNVSFNPKFDPPFDLRVEDDWMAITRGTIRNLDGEPGVSIARYGIGLETVQRMSPLAPTLEDFLEEWVQSTWEEVSVWSRDSAEPILKQWHTRLAALEHDSTEMRSIAQCAGKEGPDSRWLIDLWIDQKQNPSMQNENIYVIVSAQNDIYLVESISESRPSACRNSHPPPKRTALSLPGW